LYDGFERLSKHGAAERYVALAPAVYGSVRLVVQNCRLNQKQAFNPIFGARPVAGQWWESGVLVGISKDYVIALRCVLLKCG
jgi:hypothetical protein